MFPWVPDVFLIGAITGFAIALVVFAVWRLGSMCGHEWRVRLANARLQSAYKRACEYAKAHGLRPPFPPNRLSSH